MLYTFMQDGEALELSEYTFIPLFPSQNVWAEGGRECSHPPPRFLSALALISPDSFPSLATDEILSPISLVPRVNGLRPLFRGGEKAFRGNDILFPLPCMHETNNARGTKEGEAGTLTLAFFNALSGGRETGGAISPCLFRPCCHTCCTLY